MNRAAEVLVVGGGPAGASTAFQLARRGVRVMVLDRASFPRPKPCAECLSPQASRILDGMGVLAALERQGALLRGMAVRSPDGRWMRGDYAAPHGFAGYRDRGLAIHREILDRALLDRARDAGADVREGTRVTGIARAPSGAVNGVTMLTRAGAELSLAARFVVGADGLRSVVARRLALARTRAWPRRLSLVARYSDVAGIGEYGEMHVEGDGFVGIADTGAGLATVAAVFPESRAREIARDRHRFLDDWLRGKRHLAGRFAGARRRGPAAAIGPFASHARRAWTSGAALVGDAADFFDPFTGEGVYAALRGGELLADAIVQALGAEDAGAVAAAGRAYERARVAEFAGKWRVERIIGGCVAAPRLVNRAIRAMASRKHLADLLVGVTGDFVPAREVLNARYLASVFLMPAR